MTYKEKLLDPRWSDKRHEIITAAGGCCEDCKIPKRNLEVHHCFYLPGREPWEYESDLLTALCPDCHEFRQGREEALHVLLARTLRKLPIAELEERAWDAIHDAILEAAALDRQPRLA